jgi:SAM-dependent methyltransferase
MAPPLQAASTLTSLFNHLSLRARRRRFGWIVRTIERPSNRPLRVLDVGGTVDYWSGMPWEPLRPVEIVLLNLTAQDTRPPFTAIVGDARDLSRYANQSFDVVYSHSVIGHVGDLDDQQRMARELRRVGRQFIVQTPNQRFPLDWRTLTPGFHFLPVRAQAWCIQRMSVGRYPKVADEATARLLAARVRNVTWRELRLMFPNAVIHVERACGLPKSFIVVGGLPVNNSDKGHNRGAEGRP